MDRRNRFRFRPQLDVLEDRLQPSSLGNLGGIAHMGPPGRHDLLAESAAIGQAGHGLALRAEALHPAHSNADVFPVHSHPFGMTYGQWSAAWWQWATSLSADHHPLFDTADLSTGQSGHVWFLGGTFFSTMTPTGDFVGVANRSGR